MPIINEKREIIKKTVVMSSIFLTTLPAIHQNAVKKNKKL
jgi:hypothetical protein